MEGKDAFLALAAAYGSADNRNLEFDGPGVAALSLHDRRTIATQCAEINAEFVLFPCDAVVREHLAARGVTGFTPAVADPGAAYDAVWRLDLSTVVPQVATPGAVIGNVRDAAAAGDVRLDQCFVGSCANGHLEDFAAAAELLREALIDSIRHHFVADVPVGVFLSAGRDSTTIAALATESGADNLITLTLGFREFQGTPNDETTLAEEVAR